MIFWLGVNIPERGGQLGRNMRPMAYHNTDVTCSQGGRGISPTYDFSHSLAGLQSHGSKTQSILWIQANPNSISYLHSALIVIS